MQATILSTQTLGSYGDRHQTPCKGKTAEPPPEPPKIPNRFFKQEKSTINKQLPVTETANKICLYYLWNVYNKDIQY